jgi:23S rRNA pseudouridine1911/1915/1917 synthase
MRGSGRSVRLGPRPGPETIYLVPEHVQRPRLDAYLSRVVGDHSRSEWQRLIDAGVVLRNGRAARPADRLEAGDRITVRAVEQHVLLEPDPTIPLDVVYEDSSLIVIDKPAGLVVHPAPGNETGTLVHALLARFPELRDPTGAQRPGIVHRLDKETSGLLVVGRTPEAVTALQRQMQAGTVVKRYWLLVLGDVPSTEGLIDAPIGRDPRNRQRMAVRAGGREAQTRFHVFERFQKFSLVDALLCSGRTHQLRVHFASIGHPVAGDRVYGPGRGPGGLSRQFVHARLLTLDSPASGERLTFESALPSDLAEPLERLRRSQRDRAAAAARAEQAAVPLAARR